MREINYDIQGNTAMIGPRKFRKSNFFDKPATQIEEFGALAYARRRRGVWRYPSRSYMYSAVKRLRRRNKIAPRFATTMRRNF